MHSHGINDVYGVAELEIVGSAMVGAHELGHDLGDWRLVEDRMRLANCRHCRGLAWVVRPPGEVTWRAGGSALNGHCEGRGFQKGAGVLNYFGALASLGPLFTSILEEVAGAVPTYRKPISQLPLLRVLEHWLRVLMPERHPSLEVNHITLILFVEYHNAFRDAASVVMDQEEDLEVVSQASSVAEGRERMAQGGIDAAIVDIPLPDEGAEDMVRDLHEANPSIPVLTLTVIEDEEVIDRFLRAGASEVLPKDLSLAEVLAAVRRLGGER